MYIEEIEEMLARTMNKNFQFSNNIMLLKTVVPLRLTKLPKNKAILSFAMWSLVTIMYIVGFNYFMVQAIPVNVYKFEFTVHVA